MTDVCEYLYDMQAEEYKHLFTDTAYGISIPTFM